MKVLLLGKSGQVGYELQRTLAPMGVIKAPDRTELDLMDTKAVDDYLLLNKPEVIVNAAAWTAVDAAESQPDLAERLNVSLPKQLAQYAAVNSIRLVHYSSDYVYPGSGNVPWKENSITEPLSFYGKTKLKGDRAIEQSGADYLIFRTSWVYSARGNNFMKTMLRLARTQAMLNVVADQVGAPTTARLIAEVTSIALHAQLPKGIYHLASKGETSWHGFAEEIFRLSNHNIQAKPVATSEYPTAAERPLNSRLNTIKLEQALNIQLPSWQSQLKLVMSEYLENT